MINISSLKQKIENTEMTIEQLESEQGPLEISTLSKYVSDLANIKYLKGYVDGMKVVLKEAEQDGE